MTGRKLRRSDTFIARAVVRGLRALGFDPDAQAPYLDPTRPSSKGTSGGKHLQRLRDEGKLP